MHQTTVRSKFRYAIEVFITYETVMRQNVRDIYFLTYLSVFEIVVW